MRLTYLLAPVLGLALIGCGPDEDREREVTPPPATTEQPATPTLGPGADSGGIGDDNGTGSAIPPAGTVGGEGTAPGDNGSGLGTASGSGTGIGGSPETTPGTGISTGVSQ